MQFGGKEEKPNKKNKAIVLLNSSLQIELSINGGELLAFHKGGENHQQMAPQGRGLDCFESAPARWERAGGGRQLPGTWGAAGGAGSLDQAPRWHAGRKTAPALSDGFCAPAFPRLLSREPLSPRSSFSS